MNKEELMARANELGLDPHHATGEVKLAQLIKEEEAKGDAFGASSPEIVVAEKVEPKVRMTETQKRIARHAKLRKDQKKLIRIILRSNDPAEKEWKGKTFKFSNILHTITRFIPFDNEEGWHCEQGLLNSIQSEQCTRFVEEKTRKGRKIKVSRSTKKYTIEILKPLTKKELKALKADQSARGAID